MIDNYSENEIRKIKERIANKYVFCKPGDVVVGYEDDLIYLLSLVASYKDELEALRKLQEAAEELENAEMVWWALQDTADHNCRWRYAAAVHEAKLVLIKHTSAVREAQGRGK